MKPIKFTRRSFITSSIGASAGLAIGSGVLKGNAVDSNATIQQYRPLGDTGFKVSDIGFGAGGLKDPIILKNGLERGINYIDTAESYGKGASEEAIGKVMAKWKDREKIFITTKLSSGSHYKAENLKNNLMKALDERLKKMKIDYVDSLLIHGIDSGRGNDAELKMKAAENPELYKFVDEAKKAGKLRYFGLSSHADYKMLKYVLKYPDYYRILLYPFDWTAKPGEGYDMVKKCKENGVGLTLMKTRTGCLDLNIKHSEGVEVNKENVYRSKFTKEYIASSIRYVNNQPLTDTVLVSIRTFEDLDWAIALSGKKY